MSQNIKPKLIVSLTSPYARKVRIAALEKKIDFEMIIDVPWNEGTGVVKLNPLGKVPVWAQEGEDAIFDSRVIVEHLETLPGIALFPVDPTGKIKIKQLEALADGVADASLCIFVERKKRPQELQHQWWVDRQFGKIHRGLNVLNEKIGQQLYFAEDCLTIADIAVASALGYVGLRFSADFNWEDLYPNLAKFYRNKLERPSFRDTVPVI